MASRERRPGHTQELTIYIPTVSPTPRGTARKVPPSQGHQGFPTWVGPSPAGAERHLSWGLPRGPLASTEPPPWLPACTTHFHPAKTISLSVSRAHLCSHQEQYEVPGLCVPDQGLPKGRDWALPHPCTPTPGVMAAQTRYLTI